MFSEEENSASNYPVEKVLSKKEVAGHFEKKDKITDVAKRESVSSIEKPL